MLVIFKTPQICQPLSTLLIQLKTCRILSMIIMSHTFLNPSLRGAIAMWRSHYSVSQRTLCNGVASWTLLKNKTDNQCTNLLSILMLCNILLNKLSTAFSAPLNLLREGDFWKRIVHPLLEGRGLGEGRKYNVALFNYQLPATYQLTVLSSYSI